MKQKWRTKSLLALALLLACVLGLAWASQITSVSVAGTELEVTPTSETVVTPTLQMIHQSLQQDIGLSTLALSDAPVQFINDGQGVYVGIVHLDDPRVRVEAREARASSGAVGGYQVVWEQAQMADAVMAINADYSAGQENDMLLPDGTCQIKAWNPSGESHACSEGLFYVNGSNRSNWTEDSTGYRSSLAFDQNSNAWLGLSANVPDQYRYNVVSGGPWWINDSNWHWGLAVVGDPCQQVEFPGPPREVFGCSASGWNNARPLATAGLTADGNTLVLAASYVNMTPTQMRDFLRSAPYGVHNAIRFDSGGSTSFYCTADVPGCPSGGIRYGGRPLPNGLIIKLVEAAPPPTPSLSSPCNGQQFVSCADITLDWDESSGATQYQAKYEGPSSDTSDWISGTSWNVGALAPGDYSWQARAKNEWGESDWSDTCSFTVNPNQAPSPPSPQSPGDGTWVNSHSPTLQWSAPSDDGCPRGLTYNAQIERITGGSWSTSISDHSGTSWSPSVPSDDDYRWRAQAYDGDLSSGWSGYRTVRVDATRPDSTITSGPQGDIPVGEASFSWTGSDNITPTGNLVYSYRLRGLSDNWSAWSGGTSVSYSGLPDGDYTFEVKARDLAGNEDDTPASRSFFVDTTPPDTTVILGPSGCIGTANVTFTWTGSDNRTPTDQLQYSFWLEGYDAGWSGWSGVASKTYNGLPDGPYTFRVKARDEVGHEDPSPAGRSFQVDTTPPAGSVLINGGDSTTNKIALQLDITGDDGPVGCGVTEMRLANDDRNYEDWRSFEQQIGWYLPPVNRMTWTVHLQLKDLVGNVSGAFTDDIYLDFYPPRPASTSYQLGARVAAGGDGQPTSERYQLDGATLGQALGGGQARSRWYRLESGFQGAWPSVPRGRPQADEYDVWRSVMASSGDAPMSKHYRLYGTIGQPTSDGWRASENYQLVSGFWVPARWDVCGDDFDRSGSIGIGDVEEQIAHWRTSMGNRDPDRDPGTPNYESRFDRNLDGEINVVDAMHVMAGWGRRCWVNNP
jgi:hypothetical protein